MWGTYLANPKSQHSPEHWLNLALCQFSIGFGATSKYPGFKASILIIYVPSWSEHSIHNNRAHLDFEGWNSLSSDAGHHVPFSPFSNWYDLAITQSASKLSYLCLHWKELCRWKAQTGWLQHSKRQSTGRARTQWWFQALYKTLIPRRSQAIEGQQPSDMHQNHTTWSFGSPQLPWYYQISNLHGYNHAYGESSTQRRVSVHSCKHHQGWGPRPCRIWWELLSSSFAGTHTLNTIGCCIQNGQPVLCNACGLSDRYCWDLRQLRFPFRLKSSWPAPACLWSGLSWWPQIRKWMITCFPMMKFMG